MGLIPTSSMQPASSSAAAAAAAAAAADAPSEPSLEVCPACQTPSTVSPLDAQ
jgi:hypothetical protein